MMAKQVGPGSGNAAVCHALRARGVNEQPIRRFHQGQQCRKALHRKPGYMAAIRTCFATSNVCLAIRGRPYMAGRPETGEPEGSPRDPPQKRARDALRNACGDATRRAVFSGKAVKPFASVARPFHYTD
jgi:hypothetical protein